MTTSTAYYAKATIPDEGTDSNSFSYAVGTKTLAIHVPAMTGTGASVKIQALRPKEQENDTDVWTDVSVFDLAAGTAHVALDAILESTCVTVPVSACGPGPLRFVASESQTGGAVDIYVGFGMDG